MPSSSQKQHNLMALVATNPRAAKRLGIPSSVGRDFITADRGKKFPKRLQKRGKRFSKRTARKSKRGA